MSSGVRIDPTCKAAYQQLHAKHAHAHIIYKISDDERTIIVDTVGEPGASYDEFLQEIGRDNQCRYAVVDFEVTVRRQGTEGLFKARKAVFVQFCPDDAPVRQRMLYASSVRALRTAVGLGALVQIQASHISDLDEAAIRKVLAMHDRN